MIARKRRALPWSEVQVCVLNLIFEGRKSHEQIAEVCGVPTRTCEDWIAHPDFQAALAQRRARLLDSLDSQPYIRKERRLIALAQMAESARQEYEARPWLKEERMIGRDAESGEMLLMTNESFNRDAHAAFRGALDDIAKELGERSSSVKVSGMVEHSLVPSGAMKALGDELMAAVREMPEAQAALAARLLQTVEGSIAE
ncbi:MAG TPA: hypothetical protein VFN11_17790 [Ktedonobacterales bacterium]|nr:hypothetical protein [Ktedonobacterales bacterium]